jgi:DNA-binding NarL/FixJ family response regulator
MGHYGMSDYKGNTLNEDQIKILALLAVGTTEEKIAEQLCISTQAVRIEIDTILKKINAPNLLQAVLWAALRL